MIQPPPRYTHLPYMTRYRTSQSQTITVDDETGPVITVFPANTTVSCASSGPPADDTSVTATHACGGTLIINHDADVIHAPSCAHPYTPTPTEPAPDLCANLT